jgi:hypothetical protein
VSWAVKADSFQRSIDFVQSLLAKIRDAEQFSARRVQKIADRENTALFQAIGGPHREANLCRAQLQLRLLVTQCFIRRA